MLEVPYRWSVIAPAVKHGHLLLPLVATPMHIRCEASVIIPARDERMLIEGALQALAAQRDLDGSRLDPDRYEVIVLANNCSDDTANIARRFQQQHGALRLHIAEAHLPSPDDHVGVARRALMDEAFQRFTQLERPHGVIASTDADTRVDRDWLARTLDAVHAGADAVGGRIVVARDGSAADTWSWRYHLRDAGYRMLATELAARVNPDPFDPWPRHFQHFGPSLAVTADAYRRAGGLPPEPSLEDVAFYRALRRIDARIRHDPSVRVETSSRASHRTAYGFACQLRDWERMGAAGIPHLVRSPAAIEAWALALRDLRTLWKRGRGARLPLPPGIQDLAARLAVDATSLTQAVDGATTFGCLVEKVEDLQRKDGRWERRWQEIDTRDAIAQLRQRLAGRRSAAPALEQIEPVETSSAAD